MKDEGEVDSGYVFQQPLGDNTERQGGGAGARLTIESIALQLKLARVMQEDEYISQLNVEASGDLVFYFEKEADKCKLQTVQ